MTMHCYSYCRMFREIASIADVIIPGSFRTVFFGNATDVLCYSQKCHYDCEDVRKFVLVSLTMMGSFSSRSVYCHRVFFLLLLGIGGNV